MLGASGVPTSDPLTPFSANSAGTSVPCCPSSSFTVWPSPSTCLIVSLILSRCRPREVKGLECSPPVEPSGLGPLTFLSISHLFLSPNYFLAFLFTQITKVHSDLQRAPTTSSLPVSPHVRMVFSSGPSVRAAASRAFALTCVPCSLSSVIPWSGTPTTGINVSRTELSVTLPPPPPPPCPPSPRCEPVSPSRQSQQAQTQGPLRPRGWCRARRAILNAFPPSLSAVPRRCHALSCTGFSDSTSP